MRGDAGGVEHGTEVGLGDASVVEVVLIVAEVGGVQMQFGHGERMAPQQQDPGMVIGDRTHDGGPDAALYRRPDHGAQHGRNKYHPGVQQAKVVAVDATVPYCTVWLYSAEK